jgi:hypothetical protein
VLVLSVLFSDNNPSSGICFFVLADRLNCVMDCLSVGLLLSVACCYAYLIVYFACGLWARFVLWIVGF